jgi:hypothetical protein
MKVRTGLYDRNSVGDAIAMINNAVLGLDKDVAARYYECLPSYK